MRLNKIFEGIFIAIMVLSVVSAVENCFPQYICGPWSACDEGIQSRVCSDRACGNRDIIERDFCDKPGCKPELECDAWSQCYYTEKTNDLIQGKVSFGGYRSRVCSDKNDCVASFIQEGTCEEEYNLLLSPVEECGQDILSVADPQSKRQIAKIDLESWKFNQLDISFTQGDVFYCPSCYNTVKDKDEQGIDCGGSCKTCKKESRILIHSIIAILWVSSLIFTFLFFREVAFLRSGKNNNVRARTF